MDNIVTNGEVARCVAKPRLEYIDVMKGFAILIIVFWHTTQHFIIEDSFLKLVLTSFVVPLFYFLSGYLGYKHFNDNRVGLVVNGIISKFKILVIPSFIFSIMMCVLQSRLYIATNYGFTFSLFLMFLIMYLCVLIKNRLISNIIYFVVIVILACFNLLDNKLGLMPDTAIVSMFKYALTYMPFFLIGNFAKEYKDKFEYLLNNNTFVTLIVLFYVACFIMLHTYHKIGLLPGDGVLLGLSGIFIAFKFFHKHQSSFTNDKWLGSKLQYIGCRTMDVYCLHWFFLTLMPEISTVLKNYPLELYEFIIVALYAIITSILCLILSSVLCVSTTIEKWLFGRSTPMA